ncbi:hypothetical protein DK926_17640 [Rhodococcus sp. Eu-32]|uniref:hypothetical protein n=1 Tax=Rhodococcus sp. Eu-32 TaxID=1017319 RepID=UPI000F7A6DCD|nr:hypothetical protein [Rhodococcus sp. Eu-32]RRQ26621.1 hypothetical protein DK926_17640 [Rhodococcus sp. Eu-32]
MYSPVTHIDSRRNDYRSVVEAVASRVEKLAPRATTPFWFPGWPQEIEAALLDAVYSARASYGGENSGVRRVVAQWRAHRGGGSLDDLGMLASFVDDPEALANILGNRQRVAGNAMTKAEAAARAAAALIAAGATRTDDLVDPWDEQHAEQLAEQYAEQYDAFTSITGIGTKTWDCLLFLTGRRRQQDFELLTSFVSSTVGHDVDDCTMLKLIGDAAATLDTDAASVEHALWRVLRRPAPRKKVSA